MIDTRLANHLLWRLRHSAEADAIDHAVERGILVEEQRIAEGQKVGTFALGPAVAGKSEAEISRVLRHFASAGSRPSGAADDDEHGIVMDALQDSSGRELKGPRMVSFAVQSCSNRPDTTNLLHAVRRSAEPLRAVDVATMLLVAQSITMSPTSFGEILGALRAPSPIMTVIGRIAGFEEAFLDLLGRGLILRGTVATCRGYDLTRDGYGFRFSQVPDPRWRVVAFQGQSYDADDEQKADRRIAIAARSVYPILGVAESENCIPELLRQVARINLVCGPIDMGIICETMRAVLGDVPEGVIPQAHTYVLTLTDLALAIRPGTSAARALELLDNLAQMRLASAADDENGSGAADKDSCRKTSSSNASKSGRGNPGSGSERIGPAVLTGTDRDRFIPRVETSTGYGEAGDWALSLKDDLAHWRAGRLAWEDMSVKLLLSGPPGTGKTSFAKALCNTLQVPLIVSSVATWLEPGYLGDVLKRMSAAFAEAEASKPSILFIDELDGIGSRGTRGEFSSYWNSVVNRALELLDGATKSDGVIVVGATNNPSMIDPALLRSGRLEKHVVIPRPDTAALVGILRQHLKDDLHAVVASAPKQPAYPADAGAASAYPVIDAGSTMVASRPEPHPLGILPETGEAIRNGDV